jgi:hypothetical protein
MTGLCPPHEYDETDVKATEDAKEIGVLKCRRCGKTIKVEYSDSYPD